MIDQSLIESARMIKNQFNSLNSELDRYENEVKQVAKNLLKTADEIKKIGESSQHLDVTGIRDAVINKLGDVDIESNKIMKKIKDINQTMEKLQKEEILLYNTIKKRYPLLTDEEIKIEIQRRIDE